MNRQTQLCIDKKIKAFPHGNKWKLILGLLSLKSYQSWLDIRIMEQVRRLMVRYWVSFIKPPAG